MLDPQRRIRTQRHRLFVRAEIISTHRGHAGLAVADPFAHPVRIGLRERLDGSRRAAVRVAFAQHRVHSRSLDPVIARAGIFFGVRRRVFGVIGQRIALGLKLFDRGHKLRHRGRDVRQLDDIRLSRFDQLAQLGQRIGLALRIGQGFWKGGNNPTRQRDIARLDTQSCLGQEFLNDRQQRGRGQLRCFVDCGVDDICHF